MACLGEELGLDTGLVWPGEVKVGLGWDEGSCPAWAGMRNVEAGLGRGEGGSERIREAWGREGGVKVELKPRAGRTEGLGGIRGFLAFPGRIRTRGGPFRVLSGTRRPSKIHPLPRV